MTAPTPAAVGDAMNYAAFLRGLDSLSWEQRTISDLSLEVIRLRDHIRAIAEEMRAESIAMHVNTHDPFVEPGTREAEITAAKLLAVFADRLEGRES